MFCLLDPSDLSTFYGPCISAWISWLADLVLQDPSYPTRGLAEKKPRLETLLQHQKHPEAHPPPEHTGTSYTVKLILIPAAWAGQVMAG